MSNRPKPKSKPLGHAGLGTSQPPSHLGQVGHAFFTDTLAKLEAQRVLAPADYTALELLAETYETYRGHLQATQQHGQYITDDKGTSKLAPWYKAMTETRKEMRLLLVEMGMTPASIGKVATKPTKPLATESPLAKIYALKNKA